MSIQAFIPRTSRFSDVLMNYHFHMLDVSLSTPVVLSLLYGFAKCSAPEISIKTKTIKEGTFEYPHHVLESAECKEITLSDGAKFFDSDFSDWVMGYVRGEPFRRRNFLLIQYSEVGIRNPGAPSTNKAQPLLDLVARVPARAWYLRNCIPTNYVASDEFDALSHSVSIQSVSLQPKFFSEFSSGI